MKYSKILVPFFFLSSNLFAQEQTLPEAINKSSPTSFNCLQNHFWSLDIVGNILEWDINNGTINFVDTVLSGCPCSSIGFSDAFNSSSVSPTFYAAGGMDVIYWDGTSWVAIPTGILLWSNGGYGRFQYFTRHGISDIFRFDSNGLQTLTNLNLYSFVSDPVCDDDGTLWGLITSGGWLTDSIVRYDSTGHSIKNYYFRIDMYGNNGAFMNNGKLYLAFASVANNFANSIIEVTINSNSVAITDTIPFPNDSIYNLASCNPGNPLPLSVNLPADYKPLEIYPNPFESMFSISGTTQGDNVELYDLTGRKLKVIKGIDTNTMVDASDLRKGMFIVSIEHENSISKFSIVKY